MTDHPPIMGEGGLRDVVGIQVLARLEVPLTVGNAPADRLIHLRAGPAFASELSRRGVRVASKASYHGTVGHARRLEREVSVAAAGVGGDLGEALQPETSSHGGIRVAFVVLASSPRGFARLVRAGAGRSPRSRTALRRRGGPPRRHASWGFQVTGIEGRQANGTNFARIHKEEVL